MVTSSPKTKEIEMTLKGHHAEQQLSCRARAFSVEALLHRTTPQQPCTPASEVCSTPEVTSSDVSDAATSCGEGASAGSRGLKRECSSPLDSLRVELCSRDLWRKFHTLGTEMIITKAGRRMFPTVKARLHGLHSSNNYIIFLDIVPVDDKRYRYVYHSSQWTVAGAGDPPLPRSLYVHPDSPATGQLWMAQGVISFDKLKLTNNRRPIVRGQVSLHSMHKYQPRVHVLYTEDLETPAETQVLAALQTSSRGGHVPALHSFTFPETSFTTVTAYQNQQITRLKIASNPFAKGFREASKTRDHMDDSRPSYPRLPHFGNTDLMTSSPGYFPEFSAPSWPATLPVKFVIPPTSSMAAPLMPYLQQPSPFQCPPFRPHYLECLRHPPPPPHHNLFPSTFPHRPPEALDLSTFK